MTKTVCCGSESIGNGGIQGWIVLPFELRSLLLSEVIHGSSSTNFPSNKGSHSSKMIIWYCAMFFALAIWNMYSSSELQFLSSSSSFNSPASRLCSLKNIVWIAVSGSTSFTLGVRSICYWIITLCLPPGKRHLGYFLSTDFHENLNRDHSSLLGNWKAGALPYLHSVDKWHIRKLTWNYWFQPSILEFSQSHRTMPIASVDLR